MGGIKRFEQRKRRDINKLVSENFIKYVFLNKL